MISNTMLVLNLCRKVNAAVISSKFIENEIGDIKSPYPKATPVDLMVIKLNGKK